MATDPDRVAEMAQLGPEPVENVAGDAEDTPWRDELSDRLNRYRARRKAPPPRYPSLRLPFDPIEIPGRSVHMPENSMFPTFDPVSNHALALDGIRQESVAFEDSPAPSPGFAEREKQVTPPTVHAGAKIIEFPRFAWGPPVPPADQLAEPVSDRPRILEVPDATPPPPALGGITIEPAKREEVEKRLGIDIPLQSAPLGLRLLASLVDGTILSAAVALFALIFWKVAAIRPPQLQILALTAGILGIFWVGYQYLLIVYAATTPGLRIARLELTKFDGTATSRTTRRWRVLASCLSAASLGMGYAWLFLDEDTLCWHDRITHTYLAPRKSASHEKSKK
jgi:uncharacterized RDD family membrane protein YckC